MLCLGQERVVSEPLNLMVALEKMCELGGAKPAWPWFACSSADSLRMSNDAHMHRG